MNLYIFGDSYSVDYDASCLKVQGRKSYTEWKGYVPKKYYNHIAEKYNISEILNFSLCGNDNGNIFECYIDNYDKINPDDIVIFGWTALSRFSIGTSHKKNNTLTTHWSSCVNYNNLDWVEKAQLNHNTIFYLQRQMKLIDFINKTSKIKKLIHWYWYFPNYEHPTTIFSETNGEVYDYHYNEKKHLDLANQMMDELSVKDKINISLWDVNKFDTTNYALIK